MTLFCRRCGREARFGEWRELRRQSRLPIAGGGTGSVYEHRGCGQLVIVPERVLAGGTMVAD